MTTTEDVLGRKPIMRPIEQPQADERQSFPAEVRGDRCTVSVPQHTSGSTGVSDMGSKPVTMPRPLWEVRHDT